MPSSGSRRSKTAGVEMCVERDRETWFSYRLYRERRGGKIEESSSILLQPEEGGGCN